MTHKPLKFWVKVAKIVEGLALASANFVMASKLPQKLENTVSNTVFYLFSIGYNYQKFKSGV